MLSIDSIEENGGTFVKHTGFWGKKVWSDF